MGVIASTELYRIIFQTEIIFQMNLEQYSVEAAKDFLEYNFYSEGPKGRIKKLIRFTKVEAPSFTFYNLGFGDWDDITKTINDFVITNNRDAERVLATVSATIVDFTNHYPNAVIYAEGSTISRTRRYQMGINKYWKEIKPVFDVFGLTENEGFMPFEKGMNYLAFVAIRKKVNFISEKMEG